MSSNFGKLIIKVKNQRNSFSFISANKKTILQTAGEGSTGNWFTVGH